MLLRVRAGCLATVLFWGAHAHFCALSSHKRPALESKLHIKRSVVDAGNPTVEANNAHGLATSEKNSQERFF